MQRAVWIRHHKYLLMCLKDFKLQPKTEIKKKNWKPSSEAVFAKFNKWTLGQKSVAPPRIFIYLEEDFAEQKSAVKL